MAKLYSEKEIADLYRQANPRLGWERLSDAEILAKLPEIEGGNEWLARLAPPPPKAVTMKELAATAFKAAGPALTRGGKMKAEAEVGPAAIHPSIAAAAKAAKDLMISGPEKPKPSGYEQFISDEPEIKLPQVKPGFTPQLTEAARAAAKNVFANTVRTWLKTTDISKTEDPFAGMKQLGAVAQIKGAGYQLPPEQEKALEDFTKSNFAALVVYPAILTGTVIPVVKWYIANRTLPGAVKAAGKAIADGLVKEGFDRPTATRLASAGMTSAAAKAEAGGAAPAGIPEFVALRKAAQKGFKPGPRAAKMPAEAAPGAKAGEGAPPAGAAPMDIKAIRQQAAEIRAGLTSITPERQSHLNGLIEKVKALGPAERIKIEKLPTAEQQYLVKQGGVFDVDRMGNPLLGYSQEKRTQDLREKVTAKPVGLAAEFAGFTDKEGRVFVRLTKVPGETLAPWSWEYKGAGGEPYRGNASSKELALATIKKKFVNPPAGPPAVVPLPPGPPDTSKIWNMPLEKLQEKIINERLEAPPQMTPEEVAADMKAYPNGEYMRKWAAREDIYSKGSKMTVSRDVIKRFKLEDDLAAAAAEEKRMQGEVNKALLDARGGATPYLDLLVNMEYFSKKKVLFYLGVKTGQNWKNKEIPEELAWYIRPSGKTGPGEFTDAALRLGLQQENDIALAIDELARDRELKNALESGGDISAILRTRRDMTEYSGEVYGGGTLAAKKRPPVDLPGQTFMPGIQPVMPLGKIRKEVFVDQAEFEAAFTAAPDTPGLFDAIDEVKAGIEGVEKIKKVPSGEAATTAPPLDQPAASFQPIITDKEFKLWRGTEMLILKYAKRFGEDKVVIPHGAVGIFYPETKNIFLQAANNVYVAVHEVAHYVDDKTDWFKRVMRTIGTTKKGVPIYDPKTLWIRKLLTQFYIETYPGASATQPLKKRVKEGLAMLLQKAAETPEMMRNPTWIPLAEAVLEPGGRFYQKDFADLVKDCRAVMDQYRALDANSQIGARTLGAGGRESGAVSLFTNWNKIEEIFFDKYAKFTKMDELTGNKYGVAAAAQAYKYWSAWANSNTNPDAGLRVLLNRGFVKLGDNNLGQLFKQIGTAGNAARMDNWLIARRVRAGYQEMEAIRQRILGFTEGKYDIENPETGALQKWLKLKEAELEPQDFGLLVFSIKSNVKEYGRIAKRAAKDNIGKDLANRTYADGMRDFPAGVWAAIYNDISKAIITMEEDAGRLSHELAARYRADPAYASFRHDNMEMREDTGGGKVTGTGVKSSFTKEWKGSEEPFVGPLMGLVQNFFEAARKTSITRLNNTFHRMLEENQEMFGATAIVEKLKVIPDGKGGFDYPQLRDPNVIMARADGKFRPIRLLDKSLMGIIRVAMLDPKVADVLETIVRRFSLTFTRGTTAWYWPFALKNLPRDIGTGFIQSETGIKPGLDQAKTFRELLRAEGGPRAQAWRDYEMLTGGQQTLSRMYSEADSPEEAYRWLTGDTTKTQKALKAAETLGDALTIISKASEKFMRGEEYVKSIVELGDSVPVALHKAARVTDPFSDMGTWGGKHGRTAVKAGAFINPVFEVLAQFLRTVKDPKKQGRMLGAMIALATAAVGGSLAIRTASPQQKRNYRGLQVGMFSGNIIFPAWGEEARKKGRLITIAVSDNYAVPANLLNMIVQQFMLEDNKYTPSEYLEAASAWVPDQMNFTQLDRMIFSLMPVIMAPWLQVRFKQKTFPSVMPLTPGIVADLPREKQFTEKTSWVAKATANNIGKALNLSPIEVDVLIEGYLGRASRFVTGRTGMGIFTNPIYTDLYLNAMRDTEFYYKLRETISAQEKYFKEQIKDAAAAQAAPMEMDTEADTERIIEAARAAGVVAEGPSKELRALVRFKPYIAKIDVEVRNYRFWSRVKNPGPAARAERDKFRDMVLDDISQLKQEYEKRP